jgi:hypothetical protein
MPNWCENTLKLSGNQNNITSFIADQKINENIPISFQSTIPIPEDQKDNWHNWSLLNWGCSKDLADPILKGTTFTFASAWNPPISWFRTLCETYPALILTLSYREEADIYEGSITAQNKKLLSFTGDGKDLFTKEFSLEQNPSDLFRTLLEENKIPFQELH